MSIMGCSAPYVGFDHVNGTIGPMSTSLEGVKLFMKSVLDAKPWLDDPCLVPMPWRDEDNNDESVGSKKLKIGILWDDGIVKPHPPISRALKSVVERLECVDGVEIVEWKPYNHDLAWDIIVRHET